MKNAILIYFILILIWSCTSDPLPNSNEPVPIVTTEDASYITYTTVRLSININSTNATKIGILYSKNPTPNQKNSIVETTSSLYYTEIILNGLDYGTKYYYKAFATNNIDTVYGEIKNFTTTNATVPILNPTYNAYSITQTSAVSGGEVSSDGGFSVTSKGVCWSTTSNPTSSLLTKTNNGSGNWSFDSDITGLMAGTTYYVRAYATNSVGTGYGSQINFTTSPVILPTITTSTALKTSQSTATCGGTVSSGGGGTITARGVCWSTSSSPTTALATKTNDGTGTGVFSSSITGLLENTTYYIRAYATNSAGTAYGAQVSITIVPIVVPTITTTSVVSTSQTTATGGGNITNDGGGAVTSRGVCWSTTANPTILLSTKTADGTGIGTFTSSITGLTANTTYYIRAYATNSAGTAYGAQVSFSTTLAVGQSYQGGKIAYIFKSGDAGYISGQTHGLIAAPTDQSSGMQWYNGTNKITGATGTAIGTGNANTTAIVNSQGAGSYAAKLCYDLVLGGYSDWYLPSRDELNQLYINRLAVGGFSNGDYWSSSEYSSTNAYEFNFTSGSISNYTKSYSADYVRAIRSF
jgi:hypothetical protein